MLPRAREAGLVVQDLQDETLVYDLDRYRAYCLNPPAALVWRHCDGRTSVAEMAKLLEKEVGMPPDNEIVWLALERLGRAHLLREPLTASVGSARCSRREVMRKIALLGGISLILPAVGSIVAPTPASAATCVTSCAGKPNGVLCTPCDGSKCCSGGLCLAGSGCSG